MAVLSINDKIGKYWVKAIVKSNIYTETYHVENADSHPYFMKLFLLKNLPSQLLNDETKTVKEIEYSSRLNHRNIVSYIESGTITREDGDYQYYITNYLNGSILSDYINRNGALHEKEALKIFQDILSGLQFLHSQQPALLHNDMDPSNIMLSEINDEAVIIDLGHVAERCIGNAYFDTSDLDIFYHANETGSGIFDEQSDIFSACCILYTMLTGKIPWETEIQEGVYKEKLKSLWQYRKSYNLGIKGLEISNISKEILIKGMSLKPSNRFVDIQSIIDILENKHIDTPQDNKTTTQSSSQKSPSNNRSDQNYEDNDYAKVDVEIKRGGGNGFKDIAGMQELKDYLYQRVIYVLKNKDIANEYRITPPNGLLLYGPPGCGKTFFAEKFAEETGYNYMLIKSSDLVCGIHHATEMRIKNLFDVAAHNAPIVICFDEFDALVPTRGERGSEYEAKEVNEMLAQLNNCSKKGIFVVATTNRPDKIDPAVKRTGRIDKMYYVPLPDLEARKEMFRMYLANRPVDGDVNIDDFASSTEGYIASDIAYIVNDVAMVAAYTRQPITKELLQTTLDNNKPSLDKKCLEEYESLRKNMNSVARRIVIESL